MKDIEGSVLEFIREERPGETIARDTELLEAGLLDSIAIIKLIHFLDETFGVSVPDSDIDPATFATPAAISAYVAQRRGAAA